MAKSTAGQGFPSLAAIQANPLVGKKGKVPLPDLALDLSSSCVGWAIGVEKKLERYGKLVFTSGRGIGEKLVSFEEYLGGLISTYWPSRLLIERPSTRGHTALRHMELLGIARKVWYERTRLEIDPDWIIHPRTVKSQLKVPPGANHAQNKLLMVNKINQLYSLRLKFDAHSKLKSDDDIADAIALMTAAWRRSA